MEIHLKRCFRYNTRFLYKEIFAFVVGTDVESREILDFFQNAKIT